MKQKIRNNKEIIEKLKIVTGSNSASELARKLDTKRQNLKSFENKKVADLNNRIISLLLDLIDSR